MVDFARPSRYRCGITIPVTGLTADVRQVGYCFFSPHRHKRNTTAARFHDHIIRSAESVERIQNYIENLRPIIEKKPNVQTPDVKKVIDFFKSAFDASISEVEEKKNI